MKETYEFLKGYGNSHNPADSSKYDPNANIINKNLVTLSQEMHKKTNISINRKLLKESISENFDSKTASDYEEDLNSHLLYCHDESSLFPYCSSITLYPFLTDGLKTLGGESGPPKHLWSFAGSFVNLVFAVASQFAGAVATVGFLNAFDHFARKDFGEAYLETHADEVDKHLQQVIYSLNQPAGVRSYQAVFWNISILDRYYFESLFGDFVFPDGDKPCWNSVEKLQKFFMRWFNKEREKALLTFPVVTAAMLSSEGRPKDRNFESMCCEELAAGNSFFIYQSDSVDSLSSCCRLRSAVEKEPFSFSLGAGGIMTGSINVITINMNRLVQEKGLDELPNLLQRIYKYQVSYRKIMDAFKEKKLLPVYDCGYISLDKQFLTIGINGMVEALEYLGFEISNNTAYKEKVSEILKVIYDSNRAATQMYGYKFNTEFVPAENLGVKHAKWDREDGYKVSRDCYNSYFYPVEDDEVSIVDKFILHGAEMTKFLDGGSALHLNLEEYPDKQQYKHLIRLASKTGCSYFCTNIMTTFCEKCGYISKNTNTCCVKCGSKDVSHCTRIIGYLRKIKNFSKQRREEAKKRFYAKK